MSGADDIWNSLFGGMDGFNRRIEDLFGMMDISRPGVKTYGYSMWQGPDGVPHVREYGNCGSRMGLPEVKDPFTDVTDEGAIVRVVAEIPGVCKEDIELTCTKGTLTVRTDTPGRKFEKTLALPCEVDTGSAKAEYNNGLLEVTLDKIATQEEGTRIDIE